MNVFHDYLSPLIGSSHNPSPRYTLRHSVQNSRMCPQMLEEELRSIVMDLRNASPGCDHIRASYLKRNYNLIGEAMLHISNSILSTGIIPYKLKQAIIRPNFGSGQKDAIANYTPISLLPALAISWKNTFIRL